MVKDMENLRGNPGERKVILKRIIIKDVLLGLLFLTVLWALFSTYEYSRVARGMDTLICFNEVKEIEDDDEYSITCTGILYKYRRYYYKDSDKLSARAFTMAFNDFKRE